MLHIAQPPVPISLKSYPPDLCHRNLSKGQGLHLPRSVSWPLTWSDSFIPISPTPPPIRHPPHHHTHTKAPWWALTACFSLPRACVLLSLNPPYPQRQALSLSSWGLLAGLQKLTCTGKWWTRVQIHQSSSKFSLSYGVDI